MLTSVPTESPASSARAAWELFTKPFTGSFSVAQPSRSCAEYASNTEAINRLFNEARAVNVIEHPALVQISDCGQLPDGCAYLVMEYLNGEALNLRLRRLGGSLSEPQVLSIALQLSSVLLAAHEKGIVHRDLKPSTVTAKAGRAASCPQPSRSMRTG